MIIIITTTEVNKTTGRTELITSHGINPDTGKIVILPCNHPRENGAVFSQNYGEWIIDDTKNADVT